MNEHVHEELVEYIEGRLGADRSREIEAHVETCAECSEDLAWAREFRAAAVRQGLRHLSPERILQIADDRGGPPNADEHRHLNACPDCGKEIAWARRHSRPQERPASIFDRFFRFRWRPAVLAGGVAAAALICFVILRGPSPDITVLARHDPLPVRISRSAAEPGSFEESRMRGLESYANGDYSSARTAFQHAAELRPDDAEIALYYGSTVRLLGSADLAATLLRRAADSTQDPMIRDAALWELANALLAGARAGEARATLHELIALERAHRADAERLLDAMGAASR